MSSRRQVRELALQMLYQLDARGEADMEQIVQTVRDAPFDKKVRQTAAELAEKAWAERAAADALASELAQDWPTHRQPVVDRNLIRLGYYEMVTERAPTAVVINEAVELAKAYSSERSPTFINGVLDRIARRLREQSRPAPDAQPPAPEKPDDPWLADALEDKPPEQ